eukprot:5180197-Pleurochrysis_carterae.AAC.1
MEGVACSTRCLSAMLWCRAFIPAALSATLFCAASSAIILLNKWIVSELGFAFPMCSACPVDQACRHGQSDFSSAHMCVHEYTDAFASRHGLLFCRERGDLLADEHGASDSRAQHRLLPPTRDAGSPFAPDLGQSRARRRRSVC